MFLLLKEKKIYISKFATCSDQELKKIGGLFTQPRSRAARELLVSYTETHEHSEVAKIIINKKRLKR